MSELRSKLAELHELAGKPSKTSLDSHARLAGLSAKGSALIAAPTGAGGLAWNTVEAFVGACARFAKAKGRPLPAELVDSDRWRELWDQDRASMTPRPVPQSAPDQPLLGRLICEWTARGLGVHRAVDVAGPGSGERLPRYVPRQHDARLAVIIRQTVATGGSGMVTLVGSSSTGKTRACWEAIQQLPAGWRLWYPTSPSFTEALLDGLDRIPPRTVVWLNETQRYLLTSDPEVGERIAAGLRALVTEPNAVLVLATMWREYWSTLTHNPAPGEPDQYAQVRDLLAGGTFIELPDAFTGLDLEEARRSDDPQLAYAVAHASGGQLTQQLAGVPELDARYRTAPVVARELIHVAMDARRLGHPSAIPQSLLAAAVPGYLADLDWSAAARNGDWLEQALAYTDEPCKGVLGPLSRIWPRPHEPEPSDGPCYALADYLDQTGREERAGVYPHDSLWTAFATILTDSSLLRQLGHQAQQRARYQHAIWLFIRAADTGDADALFDLAQRRAQAGDLTESEALTIQAAAGGNINALHELAMRQELAGNLAEAKTFAVQAANRGEISLLRLLAMRQDQVGNRAGAEALLRLAVDRGDTEAMRVLSGWREQAGDLAESEALLWRAADCGDTYSMRELAVRQHNAGDLAGAEALAVEAADRHDPAALRELAVLRERAGDLARAEALAAHAASRGYVSPLLDLAGYRERAGDNASAEKLWRQAANHGDNYSLRELARRRERSGDIAGAEALWRQAADRGDTRSLRALATRREQAGDLAGAAALARQAADLGDTSMLLDLAVQWERSGDLVGAEELWLHAANNGDTIALWSLAIRRKVAGDFTEAVALAMQAADLGNISAVKELSFRQTQAGDLAGAEALWRQAGDRGNISALSELAARAEQTGDLAGAIALSAQAANRGNATVLQGLAALREQAGDSASALCIRRFGLTGSGEIATRLSFDSYPQVSCPLSGVTFDR